MPNSPSSRRSKLVAFTLIELLVVIAIVAILAAILFPVFAQAKEAAKKAACLSNLKQIGVASTLYMGDYEDTFAPRSAVERDSSNVATQRFWWYSIRVGVWDPSGGLLQPYMRSYQVNLCGSAKSILQPQGGIVVPNTYAINGNITSGWYAPGNGGEPTVVTNAGVWELPAESILLADAAFMNAAAGPLYSPTGLNTPVQEYDGAVYENRPYTFGVHAGDSANVGWMDGHAKSSKLSYINVDFAAWNKKKLGQILPHDVRSLATAGAHANYYYDPRKF